MRDIQDKTTHYRHNYDFTPDPTKIEFYKHFHSDYEFYLFLKGDVEYVIEDKLYKLKPYDLLLIKPSEYHFLRLNSLEPYERIIINFDKSAIQPEFYSLIDILNNYFNLSDDNVIVRSLLELGEISETYEQTDKTLLMHLRLNEIMIRLKNISPNTTKTAPNIHPTVSRILEYVNANITESLDIKKISAELHFSPTYISHIFQKFLKTSLMSYIRQKKIVYAQNLIRSGIKPTKASLMCGISNYTTFYRIYKNAFKISPEEEKLNSRKPK